MCLGSCVLNCICEHASTVHIHFSLTVDLDLKLLQRHAKENEHFHPPGNQPWIQLKRDETVNCVSRFKSCCKSQRRQMKYFH